MLNKKILGAACRLVTHALNEDKMYLWDSYPFYYLAGMNEEFTLQECLTIIEESKKLYGRMVE